LSNIILKFCKVAKFATGDLQTVFHTYVEDTLVINLRTWFHIPTWNGPNRKLKVNNFTRSPLCCLTLNKMLLQ